MPQPWRFALGEALRFESISWSGFLCCCGCFCCSCCCALSFLCLVSVLGGCRARQVYACLAFVTTLHPQDTHSQTKSTHIDTQTHPHTLMHAQRRFLVCFHVRCSTPLEIIIPVAEARNAMRAFSGLLRTLLSCSDTYTRQCRVVISTTAHHIKQTTKPHMASLTHRLVAAVARSHLVSWRTCSGAAAATAAATTSVGTVSMHTTCTARADAQPGNEFGTNTSKAASNLFVDAKQVGAYAAHRPTYPAELFTLLNKTLADVN